MNATPVSKRELVRLLVIEHGQKRASELSGEPYEKVRKWTQRGNWLASQSVPSTSTVDRISSELANDERETRTSLSKYARNASKEAENVNGLVALGLSDKVHNVAKTAAIVHRWDAKTENTGNVIVNVALLGIQPDQVQAQTIDVESGVSE